MLFGLAILATALLLSMVAAYYSVAGLVAIFSAATWPVIIMGGSLELGKIMATVWLHNNWRRAGIVFKLYLIPAVVFLMMLTSMGIFGFLSKAHSDQNLVSGDVQARIALYDEKIKVERENIEAARRALKQLDSAVDQVMARSQDERGAERSVQIRRGQQAERGRLLKEVEQAQRRISTLTEERTPIAAEIRKVEAEVGPIKYIAALIYGDNPDANTLERAVRWVIIMIVLVFDPLALTLILASNKQFEWARQGRGGWVHTEEPTSKHTHTEHEHKPNAETQEAIAQARAMATPQPTATEIALAMPVPAPIANIVKTEMPPTPTVATDTLPEPSAINDPFVLEAEVNESEEIKAAKALWKLQNPTDTLKHQRQLLAQGKITELPWMRLVAGRTAFGTEFPQEPRRGDTFIKIQSWPHQLFKYNGTEWIQIDKNSSDSYTYDVAYIDHLIDRVASGEYDADMLSDSEREQIQQRLETKPA